MIRFEDLAKILNITKLNLLCIFCGLDYTACSNLILILFRYSALQGGIISGIIGYITPETSFLSSPGPDITFSDAVEAVKKEAAILKAQGIDIIVAVGHAGEIRRHIN